MTNIDPVNIEPAVGSEQEGTSDVTQSKPSRKKHQITFDAAFATRFMKAEKVLSTEAGIELAQFVTGTRSENVAYLLAQLSKKSNRAKLEKLTATFTKLQTADQLTVGVLLAEIFSKSKEMTGLVYRILNIAAPDLAVGRPSGDTAKDALSIASKWQNDIDLSLLKDLII